MRASVSIALVIITTLAASGAAAQGTQLARQRGGEVPPVRVLTAPEATWAEKYRGGATNSARVLSDGRVLVHDVPDRYLWLVDASLASASIIIDKDGTTGHAYPGFPQMMVAGQGDTTYLSDPRERVFRVVAPDGRMMASIPYPEPGHILFAGLDAGLLFVSHAMIYAPPIAPSSTGMGTAENHDSLLLVRVDLATRARQQLGYIYRQAPDIQVPLDSTSTPRQMAIQLRALDIGDAMAMNSLGMLAVIRVSDFHVDWLMPDGRWRRSAAVPWPWHTYSPEEKQQLFEKGAAMVGSGSLVTLSRAGAPPTQVFRQVAPIPDLAPPFVPMSAIPDLEGRVWVRLGTRSFYTQYDSAPTYAAIDTSGQIVDRIALPIGRTLAGFGPPGTAYAVARDGNYYTIERYSIRR